GPQQRRERGVGLGDRVRVGGDEDERRARVGGVRGPPQAVLVRGQRQGGAVLGLAAVDVRVVARDDDDGVGPGRRGGHLFLAARRPLDREDRALLALAGDLQHAGGGSD